MNTLGTPSKTTILTSEAHKTTQEFTVGATAVKKGQPVMLDATGKVIPWDAADRQSLIGYSYADAAIGDNTTVWTRGYMIVFALSSAALIPGPVTYVDYNTAAVSNGNTGFSRYKQAVDEPHTNGWALDVATAANKLIRVLLMG